MQENENEDQNVNEETQENRLTGDPRKDIVVYGEKNRFSKDKQPSNDAKKAGWARKLRNRKLAQMLLNRKFVGKVMEGNVIVDSKFKKLVRNYFHLSDEEMDDMSNEAALMMRMIGQAIENGDTQAAAAMLERAYGKPKELSPFEDPENEDEVDQKPTIVIQVVQSIDLPEIKNREDGDDEIQS